MPISNLVHKEIESSANYTQDYRIKCFMLWYNQGRPGYSRLSTIIGKNLPPDANGRYPSKPVLIKWIEEEFVSMAMDLDEQIANQLEVKIVSEKIKMLEEHAKIGHELASMGLEHLKESGLGNARNALTAVIEGLRIERESRGVPQISEKLAKMSDEELLGQLTELISSSSITDIIPNVEEDDQ
jgi:hypothetical protein